MTPETYLTFLAAVTVLIVMPGPTNFMVVCNAMRAGFLRPLWTVAELFDHPRQIRIQNRVTGSLLIGAGILLATTEKR